MEDNKNGQQKPSLSWSQPNNTPKAAPVNASANPVKPVVTAPAVTKPAATTVVTSQSNMGTYVGIFVAGLIVGALIGWAITGSRTSDSTSTAATSTPSTTTTSTIPATGSTATATTAGSSVGTASTADNITIAATQPAGFTVNVSKVSVTQPTWLVVYEDQNGTFGNALGAGLFFAADSNGTIQLLRATVAGQSYFVGESVDSGNKTFSLETDKPVLDAQGNPVFTQFTAQ